MLFEARAYMATYIYENGPNDEKNSQKGNGDVMEG